MNSTRHHTRAARRGRLAMALVIGLTTLIAGAGGLGSFYLQSLDEGVQSRLGAHVLVTPGQEDGARALAAEIEGWPQVAAVRFRDGAANHAWLQGRAGADVAELDPATVPSSLSLTFADPASGLDAVRPGLQALESRPGVIGVEVSRPDTVAAASRLGTWSAGALGLAMLGLVGGVLLVSTLQGASILRRREEIEVARILGGTDRQVVWPFYREALGSGALGGLAGAAAAAAARWVAPSVVSTFGELLQVQAPMALAAIGACALVVGVCAGVAGTAIGVRRALRPIEGVA